MELHYGDLFSLVAVNRFSRLFNQYNMLVQSLNMRTEKELNLNPDALTSNSHKGGWFRDNRVQYESSLMFAANALFDLGENEQAERVALMRDESHASEAYMAFIEQMEGDDSKVVTCSEETFICHAEAVCNGYRERNHAHVKIDFLSTVMTEAQIMAYRAVLKEHMGMRIFGNAEGQVHHLQQRLAKLQKAA
tara:strand:- start:521 stop:1096 length:576 start_codon:yes stop_codon:yes gene_type:complete